MGAGFLGLKIWAEEISRPSEDKQHMKIAAESTQCVGVPCKFTLQTYIHPHDAGSPQNAREFVPEYTASFPRRYECFSISIPCMALQPLPGPWPPSKRASTCPCFQLFSSTLLLLTAVMHPSEPRLPIRFLVFPLVLCCGRFHLKPFLGCSLPPFLLYGPPTLVF